MAINFIQPGDNLTLTAPVAVTSGEVVVQGSLFGIALTSAATGEKVDVATGRVWLLPKVAADAFTAGSPVYYAAGAKLATTTASGNTKIGVAIEAAPADSAAVKVRLNASF